MERTVVLTGASDGIGAAAARLLHARGARVVVVGRSAAKTAALAADLGVPHHVADYSRLEDVRRLAAELLERYPRIDVLAHNAGGIMSARELTADGFEKTFQVNHLAPFLLNHLLLGRLVESRATVVATSSAGARLFGHLDLTDLDNHRSYSPRKAYGDAKLANILFARELQRRHGGDGVNAASFHPGVVATSFAGESSSAMRLMYTTPLRRFLLTPERGADTLVWLAEGTPGVDWVGGEFYTRRTVSRTNPQAADAELARGLWDASEQMLGLATRTA
ncbi:SDR family NAD(P)-dependent oxidoreductase [Actinotalea subterranea]|uniref:SDR family NAD(P)-dependent oxidoreductase n=1 Tax=Actinotalea subterranea TaxID=2607497 RepID=UPI0011EDB081|nr:SDR family NAD(P)-dependent oxidoreductase [Actinotalea subterranea]